MCPRLQSPLPQKKKKKKKKSRVLPKIRVEYFSVHVVEDIMIGIQGFLGKGPS
jgi:hypothetical protein